MGRKKLDIEDKKMERIAFRLTADEKERLEKLLKKQNKKLGDVLRNYIDGYLQSYKDLFDEFNERFKHIDKDK